ncbi:MAG: site-specific DNA-methyltransferase [Candidatus Saccharimonadales bacterium]
MTKALEDYTKEELIEVIKGLKRRKKFGLVWEDKPEEVVRLCDANLPVVEQVPKLAILKLKDTSNNIIIEGDNYHSLSALNYTHAGRVDVIYIDPPYNTGNKDFIYNDHYVDNEDTFRHSKWLSFMSERLRLAKELLASNGVIFISIDDNEHSYLRVLCNQIFGEENFLTNLNIQVRYAGKSLNEEKPFKPLLEYVLVYAKNARLFQPNRPQEQYTSDKFIYEVEELHKGADIEINGHKVTVFKKGQWKLIKHKEGANNLLKETWVSGSIYTTMSYGKVFQAVVEPRVAEDGLGSLYKVHGRGDDGLGYRYYTAPQRANATRGKMYSGVPLSRIEEMNTDEGAVRFAPIPNFYDFSADFGNIRHEGGIGFNSGKKPVKMLKQLINYHKGKDITVLDFFAGSGSTGHAVIEANKDDSGNRRFILCTNNENKIAEQATYPRISNVINGYAGYKGIPANVRYFRTSLLPKKQTDDQTRIELVARSTDMICLREDTFEKAIETKRFKVFGNNDHYTAIVFEPEVIVLLKDALAKLKDDKPVHIYVFSLSNDTYESDFADLERAHELRPIPESILEVYRRIHKEQNVKLGA